MVLINGVKYACERCIRGHRVTTCTHTDQPLTMIKPKGRPASQCQHCRDQRKNKNLHVSCTCGKKGKSPGMHLALCACHKNTHCTCSSGNPTTHGSSVNGSAPSGVKARVLGSKLELSRRRSLLERSQSDLSLPLLDAKSNSGPNGGVSGGVGGGGAGGGGMAAAGGGGGGGYLLEYSRGYSSSSHLPYSLSEQSSLDEGAALGGSAGGNELNGGASALDPNYIIEDVVVPFEPGLGLFDLFLPSPEVSAANSSSNSKTNVNDAMNVDNSGNHLDHGISRNNSTNTNLNFAKQSSISPTPGQVQSHGSHAYAQGQSQGQQQAQNQSVEEQLELADGMFPLFPLIGTTSFDTNNKPLSKTPSLNHGNGHSNNGTHYQPIRPKRPESVLSIASNSSTGTSLSKNIDTHAGIVAATSSAYPPVSYSQSSFDLNTLNSQQSTSQKPHVNNNYSHKDLDLLGGYASSSTQIDNGIMFQPTSQPQFTDLNNLFNEESDERLAEYELFLNELKGDDKRSSISLVISQPQQGHSLQRQLLQQFQQQQQQQQQLLHHQQQQNQLLGVQSPLSPISQQSLLQRNPLLQQRQRQLLQLLHHLNQLLPHPPALSNHPQHPPQQYQQTQRAQTKLPPVLQNSNVQNGDQALFNEYGSLPMFSDVPGLLKFDQLDNIQGFDI